MSETREADFLEVQTWFIIKSQVASKSDSKFYVVMSPEETIEYLKRVIESRAASTNVEQK